MVPCGPEEAADEGVADVQGIGVFGPDDHVTLAIGEPQGAEDQDRNGAQQGKQRHRQAKGLEGLGDQGKRPPQVLGIAVGHDFQQGHEEDQPGALGHPRKNNDRQIDPGTGELPKGREEPHGLFRASIEVLVLRLDASKDKIAEIILYGFGTVRERLQQDQILFDTTVTYGG